MSIVNTSTDQAGARAPAEAPKLKTFRVVIAQSFLHVIDVAAPDVETAEDIAWDSYHGDHHRCGDRCAKGEAEVIDTVEVQS